MLSRVTNEDVFGSQFRRFVTSLNFTVLSLGNPFHKYFGKKHS